MKEKRKTDNNLVPFDELTEDEQRDKEEGREVINDLRKVISDKEAEEKEQRERELLLQLAEKMQREHIKNMKFNAVIGIMAAVFSFLMLLVLLLKYC